MQPITEAQKARRERIQFLYRLLARADYEASLTGFRGGQTSKAIRSGAVGAFKRELNLLTRAEEKEGLGAPREELP